MGMISEKELKLLLNLIKDDLIEIQEADTPELNQERLKKLLDHIQQYLED